MFDVPLVIMMTDDEKTIFGKKTFTKAEMQSLVRGNARDILAVGFDPKKTFLFSDFEFMGGAFYRNVVSVSRCITLNASKAVFGFNDRCVDIISLFRVSDITYMAVTLWVKHILCRFRRRHLSPLRSLTYLGRMWKRFPEFRLLFLAPSTKILTFASAEM